MVESLPSMFEVQSQIMRRKKDEGEEEEQGEEKEWRTGKKRRKVC